MPLHLSPWHPIHKEGNPTRSEALNAVISEVRKFEVRQQGVSTSARRSLEFKEYENILNLVKQKANKAAKVKDLQKYYEIYIYFGGIFPSIVTTKMKFSSIFF